MTTKVNFLRNKYTNTLAYVSDTLHDTLHDVTISDQDLLDTFASYPRIYGDAALSDQDVDVLKLPPNFAIYDKIDDIDCEAQIEKGIAKLRWAINEAEQAEVNAIRPDRTVLNAETKTFDFRQMRGTDLPFNKRITLPKPVSVDTEAKLHILKTLLKPIRMFVITRKHHQVT